jgi:hypothetical protein
MHLTTDSSNFDSYWFLSALADDIHYYDDARFGTGLDYYVLPPKPVLVTGTDGGVWS